MGEIHANCINSYGKIHHSEKICKNLNPLTCDLYPFHSGHQPTGTLANSEDLDEMPCKILFHISVACLLQHTCITRIFFCLISLFTSQSTIFRLCQDGSSWVEPVLSKDKCVLLNTVTPVRTRKLTQSFEILTLENYVSYML